MDRVLSKPQRTIAIRARGRRRLSRLRLTYPDQVAYPNYDAEFARELLIRTAEIPDSKRALIVMLAEYRHALRDLAVPPDISPGHDRDHGQGSSGALPATTSSPAR